MDVTCNEFDHMDVSDHTFNSDARECWERQKTRITITNISSITSQDHVSKLFETSAEPSTMQRLEGLEIEQRSEKEHFEKLVKYCESSLQGLKDDLDEHVSELRSEMAGRSLEVEGMKLSERMDQLWSKCTEWDLGFRELQWKVSKVSEQILGRKNFC